jgi:hypothetical protein
MHRVKDANPLRKPADFGRREVAVEKDAQEDRFRLGGAVHSPAEEIDDATAMASIANTATPATENACKIQTRTFLDTSYIPLAHVTQCHGVSYHALHLRRKLEDVS